MNNSQKKSTLKTSLRTYNTKISVVEKELNINLGQKNPDMKLGDFLAQNGYKPLADILKLAK